MKGPLAGLMQQAQKMQEKMAQAQKELAAMEVTGEAGGGMVKVTLNGEFEARRISIDREIMRDDPEMAEDLVAAAINDAVNKLNDAKQEKMGDLAGGLNLPPGIKLPF